VPYLIVAVVHPLGELALLDARGRGSRGGKLDACSRARTLHGRTRLTGSGPTMTGLSRQGGEEDGGAAQTVGGAIRGEGGGHSEGDEAAVLCAPGCP